MKRDMKIDTGNCVYFFINGNSGSKMVFHECQGVQNFSRKYGGNHGDVV
jgi:hypothetical protein